MEQNSGGLSEGQTTEIHYITCPLCEATCGLEVHVSAGKVSRIQGDKRDPLSHGHMCPKGTGLKGIHEDEDRVRKPLIRRGDTWREAEWGEAFNYIRQRISRIREEHGNDAVGIYLGNPNVHNLDAQLYLSPLMRAVQSKNRFSASTIDQMPKQLTAALLYGDGMAIPIPDVDRTDYLLIIGGNPLVSNGSMMTAPDMRRRLRNIQERGGKVVVFDPVRTRTAQAADEHDFIIPGTDAWFLLGILHTLFTENLVKTGHLTDYIEGLSEIESIAKKVTPELAAQRCGIPAYRIQNIARSLGTVDKSVVYGRMGTCTQDFGGLTTWLIDVVNIVAGNLDREGGCLFPKAAAKSQNVGQSPVGVRMGRYHSRVSGRPEVLGELPAAALVEEMDTPGEGQIKALITVAGNPALSTPDSGRFRSALSNLEFMVSVDFYRNETTAYADVILPVPSPLERPHYDLTFTQLAVRNIAHYSPPVFAVPEDQLEEWEVLLHLTAALNNQPYELHAPDDIDSKIVRGLIGAGLKALPEEQRGTIADQILQGLGASRGPLRLLDLMLRTGPYGDQFGRRPDADGLSLEQLYHYPHGLDLGPLEPRLAEVLQTPSHRINLAPDVYLRDLQRLWNSTEGLSLSDSSGQPVSSDYPTGDTSEEVARGVAEEPAREPAGQPGSRVFLLVGRRLLHSNNSWMHNISSLKKSLDCTLWLHPADAAELQVQSGNRVVVSSTTGQLKAEVMVTENVMRGVASLPHGFGHTEERANMGVAMKGPGVNFNVLSDARRVDESTGNAVFNGIAVQIHATVAHEEEME